MMYWYGSGMSGWGYALMTVSMILFWGAVIFGIVALVRYFGRSGQPPEAPPPPHSPALPQTPEQLLAERFARGEIDEEEYRHRLAVLRGESQPANGQTRPPGRAPDKAEGPACREAGFSRSWVHDAGDPTSLYYEVRP